MGQCGLCTKGLDENDEDAVDKFLREQKEKMERTFKILLLGAGESGKSTIVKQVKMINIKGGMSQEERATCGLALKRNICESVKNLVDAKLVLGSEEKTESGESFLSDFQEQEVLAFANEAMKRGAGQNIVFPPGMSESIAQLWASPAIQMVYQRRDEFHLLDGVVHFMENVVRIAAPGFVPDEEDLMWSRTLTRGIDETEWSDPPFYYNLVDVAGQRGARAKWIDSFSNVKVVIFLCGLSGYAQKLLEDKTVCRLQESFDLFEQMAKHPAFLQTKFVLFLNKKDLFEDMIKTKHLCTAFPSYTGPKQQMRPALDWIKQQFQDRFEDGCYELNVQKKVQIDVISARVRMDVKYAFGAVKKHLVGQFENDFGKKKAGRTWFGMKKVSPKKQAIGRTSAKQKNILGNAHTDSG